MVAVSKIRVLSFSDTDITNFSFFSVLKKKKLTVSQIFEK